MTLFDRALTKAYARRLAGQTARPVLERQDETERGWVSCLRAPIGPPAAEEFLADDRPPPETAGFVDQPRVPPAAEVVPPPSSEMRIDTSHVALTEVVPAAIPSPASEELSSVESEFRRNDAVPTWRWPEICSRLLDSAAGSGFQGLASLLQTLPQERGERVIAFSGPSRRGGRSTLVLTLAKILAERAERRVLLVDTDVDCPGLARLLSLESPVGLWEAACGKASAEAVLVTLIPGRLSCVPLRASVVPREIDGDRTGVLRNHLRQWSDRFDLVLIDAGAWDTFSRMRLARDGAIDAVVSVCRHHPSGNAPEEVPPLEGSGVELLGVVETFAPAPERATVASR